MNNSNLKHIAGLAFGIIGGYRGHVYYNNHIDDQNKYMPRHSDREKHYYFVNGLCICLGMIIYMRPDTFSFGICHELYCLENYFRYNENTK